MIFPLFFKPNPHYKGQRGTANSEYDIIWETNGKEINYNEAREWERKNIPEIANFRIKEVRFARSKIIEQNANGEKLIITLKLKENTITEKFYGKEKTIEKTTVFNEKSIDYITAKIRNKEQAE